MNLINHLLISLFVIILISCNTKTSKSVETIIIDQVEEISNQDEKTSYQEIKEEFKLTDDNVIDFLYEYEKSNKENKIRIYTKSNYFEGTQFYRVVNDFVIQAGNSDNIKTSVKRQKIGKYLLPNDFNKGHTHKRGMVSMPSSSIDNPYKMASPYEFFIVQKKDGAHHLDGNYTIFGTVINGMEIVDIIASLPTDQRDWPLNNVYINKIEIIN